MLRFAGNNTPVFALGTAVALALFGCMGKPTPAAVDAGIDDAGVTHHLGLATTHVASCDDPGCGENANPPLGGPHCPTWSACQIFDAGLPVKRCNWLHNLEHGHVVLSYHCPSGCPELVAQLTQVWQEARDAGNTRVLVTPDAQLPSTVAAIVWGWGWWGDSFDREAIRAVMSHQDEDAPEPGQPCF